MRPALVALVHEAQVGFINLISYMRHTLGLEIPSHVSIETVLDPSNWRGKQKKEPRAPKGFAGPPVSLSYMRPRLDL
jgi:hypothetical protein